MAGSVNKVILVGNLGKQEIAANQEIACPAAARW